MILAPVIFALAILAFLPARALGDYQAVGALLDGQTSFGGLATIQSYDGHGAPGGGLQAGQIRITFDYGPPSSPEWPPPFSGATGGIRDLSFGTSIPNLTASQITASNGYKVSVDEDPGGRGSVVWLYTGSYLTLSPHFDVLISGLGDAATPASIPRDHRGWAGADWDWEPAPEPSTLLMSALGLVAVCARPAWRRLRASA